MIFIDHDSSLPLFEEDKDNIRNTIKKYNLVPVYGNREKTAITILNNIRELCRLSTTFQSSFRDICAYAFGEIDIVKRQIPGLKIEDEESNIDFSVKLKFNEWLEDSGVTLIRIKKISKKIFRHLSEKGDAYLLIRIVIEGGEYYVHFKSIHYTKCLYLRTETGEDKVIVVSNKFDEKYWKNNPPKLYLASFSDEFNWQQSEAGVFETLLHLKNDENTTNDWYGESPIISGLKDLFSEISNSDLDAKVASSELVAKLLLLLQEPDRAAVELDSNQKQSLFSKAVAAVRSVVTRKGSRKKVSSIAVLEYPNSSKNPLLEKMEVNRDVPHKEYLTIRVSSVITSLLGWSLILTGRLQVKSGIGGNILKDMFLVKNESTIKPLQADFAQIWNKIISEIVEITGKGDATIHDNGIVFVDKITSLAESIGKSNDKKTIDDGNID